MVPRAERITAAVARGREFVAPREASTSTMTARPSTNPTAFSAWRKGRRGNEAAIRVADRRHRAEDLVDARSARRGWSGS